MNKNNRLFKTVRNISWRAIVLLMTAIANLIIPRYIILIYGSDVNGLTTSITHILSIVNLIQAGLGSSVTYLMYRPIGENDRVALGSIILSAKRIYRYISIGVAVLGIIASVFFAFFVKTDLQREYILIASLITCIDSAASTYFTAVGNVFLGAKQDGYLVSRITIVANLVGYALRILVIIFKPHYMYLYIVNMLVCVVNIIGIMICFKKQYKPFEPTAEERAKLKYIKIPSVSYAAANEIAHALVNGSVTIVISLIAGLKASSIFGVYIIPISALSTLSNAVYSAVVPSYGSVVAENDIKKTNRIFEIYQFVLFSMNAFLYMCAAYLFMPFIKLYTSGITDADYYNKILMILVIVFGISNVLRIPYNNTVYVKGLFKETYLQPLICSAIALVMMVGFSMLNYTYTIVGSIFFFMMNTFYQHFKIPRLFKGFVNGHFWRHLAVISIGVTMAIIAQNVFPLDPKNFVWWGIYAIVTAMIVLLLLLGLIYLVDKPSLLLTIDYFKNRRK